MSSYGYNPQQSRAPATPLDFCRSIIRYRELFNTIDDSHPEADVRHRFLGLRARRARYVEWRVMEKERQLNEFLDEVETNPDVESLTTRLDAKFCEVDHALRWHSQIFDDDSKAACGPAVVEYFLDHVFRHHLDQHGRTFAPNGGNSDVYGVKGDPASASLTTPRGCDLDFFSKLILNKLREPFRKYVIIPIRKICNKAPDPHEDSGSQGLNGATLERLVYALECGVMALYVAASVGVMMSIHSDRAQLIFAAFATLGLPFFLAFLSIKATHSVLIVLGFWAVLVFSFDSLANKE